MARHRHVVDSQVQEILNYFGKCPVCDHPCRARRITAAFDDGRTETQDIAECGGWCGWKGPVHASPMTPGLLITTSEQPRSTGLAGGICCLGGEVAVGGDGVVVGAEGQGDDDRAAGGAAAGVLVCQPAVLDLDGAVGGADYRGV